MSKRTLNEEEIQPNIKIPLQPFLKDDQPEGEVAIKTGSCWRWNHCDSFVKLVFKKNLGLELVDENTLSSTEAAFLSLPQIGEWSDEEITSQIEKVSHGPDSPLIKFKLLVAIRGLRGAIEEAKHMNHQKEKKIDILAFRLVDLCGLSEGHFNLSVENCNFKFLGLSTASQPDVMVIESKTKDLVIIFEDKTGHFRHDGYLGQIVSELLMCHYHNHFQLDSNEYAPPNQVFLLRCFQHYVSAFSMTIERDTLDSVCHHGNLIRGKKLQLLTDANNPTQERGYNLLVPNERKSIIFLIETMKKKCERIIDPNIMERNKY